MRSKVQAGICTYSQTGISKSVITGYVADGFIALKEVKATKSLDSIQTSAGIPISLKTSDHSVMIKATAVGCDDFLTLSFTSMKIPFRSFHTSPKNPKPVCSTFTRD